jgi:hypothetical protein
MWAGINQVLPIKFLNPVCESFVINNEIRFIEINGNRVFLHLKDSTIVAI